MVDVNLDEVVLCGFSMYLGISVDVLGQSLSPTHCSVTALNTAVMGPSRCLLLCSQITTDC